MIITNKDIRFYDTCSLLIGGERIFKKEENFIISSVTIQELEHIKVSNSKDTDIKYVARLILNLLEKYPQKYEVIIHTRANELEILKKGFDITNDTQILSDAYYCNNKIYIDRVIFVTNDIALKYIANCFFGDKMIETVIPEIDSYTGYKEVCL